ncbi:hypothetical protein Gocc_3109 [Gaiella occulta]|uniref:Uncharacterized protein n=1 Tax=Gaiella occulta TaxID=1002870 RepID=A0A7M2YUM1_9ACTN|nr:hypothetical protein Gocc_3109 [Gaiella occulta]
MAAGGEVGGGGVVDAVARLDRLPGETDREHRLAHPGWADEQEVGGLLDEAQRCELVDELSVERGLGVEVEVVQGPGRGQAGETQPPGEAAGLGRLDLDLEQPLEEGGVRELLLAGALELARERLGGGLQAQVVQVLPQLLVAALGGGHRDASA